MRAEPISILIVEDNESDAELVAEGLGGGDIPVQLHVVKDGRSALELLRHRGGGDADERPDLMLLDLNLPRFSGFETLAELKADEDLRRIPVVVLTTSKSQREINRSYELGAAAVLNKPLRLAGYRELLGALRRFWLGHVLLPRDAV